MTQPDKHVCLMSSVWYKGKLSTYMSDMMPAYGFHGMGWLYACSGALGSLNELTAPPRACPASADTALLRRAGDSAGHVDGAGEGARAAGHPPAGGHSRTGARQPAAVRSSSCSGPIPALLCVLSPIPFCTQPRASCAIPGTLLRYASLVGMAGRTEEMCTGCNTHLTCNVVAAPHHKRRTVVVSNAPSTPSPV